MADANAILHGLQSWFAGFIGEIIPHYILPNIWLIIQIIVVLVVGYIAGKVSKAVVKKILRVVGLKRITAKIWAEDVLRVTGYRGNIIELIGDIVKWSIYIITLAVVVQTLGFTTLAVLFGQVIAFIPRIILAILIVIIGFMIADFFGRIFDEGAMKIFDDELLAKFSGGIVKYSISMIAVIISLSLIGLDINAMLILFTAMLSIVVILFSMSLKDIMPNFSAGMHVKNTFKVGERIKVRGYSGVIEHIGPYSVTLLDRKKQITIPNSILLKEPVEREVKSK